MFGLQQTMGAFARAVSPAFVRCVLPFALPSSNSRPKTMNYSSLYAFSADHPEILYGNLVWVVMATLAIYGAYVSSRVKDVNAAPIGHKAVETGTSDDAQA